MSFTMNLGILFIIAIAIFIIGILKKDKGMIIASLVIGGLLLAVLLFLTFVLIPSM